MRKKISNRFSPGFAAVCAVLFAVCCVNAQTVRVRLARGAVSTVVAGRLSGYRDARTFLVKVRGGQTLSTRQVGTANHITVFVTDPAGRPAGDSDASCNNRREITPTAAGTYSIRVVECRKADPFRGPFCLRIDIR